MFIFKLMDTDYLVIIKGDDIAVKPNDAMHWAALTQVEAAREEVNRSVFFTTPAEEEYAISQHLGGDFKKPLPSAFDPSLIY